MVKKSPARATHHWALHMPRELYPAGDVFARVLLFCLGWRGDSGAAGVVPARGGSAAHPAGLQLGHLPRITQR